MAPVTSSFGLRRFLTVPSRDPVCLCLVVRVVDITHEIGAKGPSLYLARKGLFRSSFIKSRPVLNLRCFAASNQAFYWPGSRWPLTGRGLGVEWRIYE